MWTQEPGVAEVFAALAKLKFEAQLIETEAGSVQSASAFGIAASILGIPGILSFIPQLSALSNLSDNATKVLHSVASTVSDAEKIQGMINYDPLEKLMRAKSSFFLGYQQQSGIALRLAMVALEDGALRYVKEDGTLMERNGASTLAPPQVTVAQVDELETNIALELAKRPGLVNAVATGGVNAKQQLSDLDSLVAQLKQQLLQIGVLPDLIRSAIASSSLPMICRPTVMHDNKTYVDGGIRTLCPIQAAIDAGASQVYAIAAGSQKFDVASMAQIESVLPLPLLGIALRVGEGILPDEVGRKDLFPDNPWPVPVMVIQPDPTVDDIVHDGLTLEPGLIRINMAYGYMRAYDTIVAFEKFIPSAYQYVAQENSIKGKTTEIIQLRRKIWEWEFLANGKRFEQPTSVFPPEPWKIVNLAAPDTQAHDEVKKLKAQLKTLIDARIAYYTDARANVKGTESLPEDFATWSTQWEKHSFTPTIPL
jgi:hypothetical protein